ncbi:MAG: hypothetical protein HYV63_30470 [Candidatus Schekmanbacteria bacterium]|nr:hypothetical protein [Candidatus Schekmanbacteria bacterium]
MADEIGDKGDRYRIRAHPDLAAPDPAAVPLEPGSEASDAHAPELDGFSATDAASRTQFQRIMGRASSTARFSSAVAGALSSPRQAEEKDPPDVSESICRPKRKKSSRPPRRTGPGELSLGAIALYARARARRHGVHSSSSLGWLDAAVRSSGGGAGAAEIWKVAVPPAGAEGGNPFWQWAVGRIRRIASATELSRLLRAALVEVLLQFASETRPGGDGERVRACIEHEVSALRGEVSTRKAHP